MSTEGRKHQIVVVILFALLLLLSYTIMSANCRHSSSSAMCDFVSPHWFDTIAKTLHRYGISGATSDSE
jgi:hypothetical protein